MSSPAVREGHDILGFTYLVMHLIKALTNVTEH